MRREASASRRENLVAPERDALFFTFGIVAANASSGCAEMRWCACEDSHHEDRDVSAPRAREQATLAMRGDVARARWNGAPTHALRTPGSRTSRRRNNCVEVFVASGEVSRADSCSRPRNAPARGAAPCDAPFASTEYEGAPSLAPRRGESSYDRGAAHARSAIEIGRPPRTLLVSGR